MYYRFTKLPPILESLDETHKTENRLLRHANLVFIDEFSKFVEKLNEIPLIWAGQDRFVL